MKIYRVIGLMSGTSLDGVDVALLRTDGESHIEREAFLSLSYDDILRAEIRSCFGKTSDVSVQAEKSLTVAHAEAVHRLLERESIQSDAVDLIGFHGQTIMHAPAKRFTCQIGDGALLASMTGIKVVNDFRTADVKAGGQGAPLVPVYHQALAAKLEKSVVFLNIGGVANVTYVGKNGELIAFDTGPGNALIDDWMLQKTGHKFDPEGKHALSGKVDDVLLKKLLAHPFFAAPPPKSLDRDAFASRQWEHLSVADGAATLAAFTAQSIVAAARHFPLQPKQWLVAGGGRHNKFLMGQLQRHLNAPVRPIDELDMDGDAIEAEAFAYLAVRSVRGLPISFPTTTGVPEPMTGGRLSA